MIRGLSLEISNSTPIVFASVRGVVERIPLGLISTGLTKLVAYLVAIANNNGGIVMIDEIENGFYYDSMPAIWRILYRFSREHNVQLFASSHSAECLNAAATIIEGHEDDFCVLRAERKDGECSVRYFNGITFKHAIAEHAEVR